jgi:hypothetical protein
LTHKNSHNCTKNTFSTLSVLSPVAGGLSTKTVIEHDKYVSHVTCGHL